MDRDRLWDHQRHYRPFYYENGSSVAPMENGGINGQHSTMTRRLSEHPLNNFTGAALPATVPTLESTHSPYPLLSVPSTSNQVAPNYGQGYSHDPRIVHHTFDGTVNSHMESVHRSFKRKHIDALVNYGIENTNMHYVGGSTGHHSFSSHPISHKPVSGSQVWPPHPHHMVPDHTGNKSCFPGNGSQRNVRSRLANIHHSEMSLSVRQMSDNLPENYSHFILPGNFPGPSIIRQHNRDPHGKLISSDMHMHAASGGYNLEINQNFAGSSASGGFPNIAPIRVGLVPPPVHGSFVQSIGGNYNPYVQRSIPIERSVPSYSLLGNSTACFEEEWRGPGSLGGHSRPLSIGGARDSDRNRWMDSGNRVHHFTGTGSAPGRWTTEGFPVIDQSTVYDSSYLLDQHRDMRLDIDNMGYEELLALEERIGNVNTGLSDEMLPRCLTESAYCSGDKMQEEAGSCVICLESYRDKEQVGLLRCGHNYHACCIKEWLWIKNSCPICKAPALEK